MEKGDAFGTVQSDDVSSSFKECYHIAISTHAKQTLTEHLLMTMYIVVVLHAFSKGLEYISRYSIDIHKAGTLNLYSYDVQIKHGKEQPGQCRIRSCSPNPPLPYGGCHVAVAVRKAVLRRATPMHSNIHLTYDGSWTKSHMFANVEAFGDLTDVRAAVRWRRRCGAGAHERTRTSDNSSITPLSSEVNSQGLGIHDTAGNVSLVTTSVCVFVLGLDAPPPTFLLARETFLIKDGVPKHLDLDSANARYLRQVRRCCLYVGRELESPPKIHRLGLAG
jgi:hypothetical protein